jgi:chromosomal replication initiation ATPase DnaA
MNDNRDLPIEIRRLREAIELLSEAVADGAKIVSKITKERERIEFALQAQTKNNIIPAVLRRPESCLNALKNVVALQWCVTIDQLCGQRRSQDLAIPRFAFCHIAHKRLSYTASEVCDALNRDHTTILHACKRADEMLATDKDFESNYNAVWIAIQASQTPTSQEQH